MPIHQNLQQNTLGWIPGCWPYQGPGRITYPEWAWKPCAHQLHTFPACLSDWVLPSWSLHNKLVAMGKVSPLSSGSHGSQLCNLRRSHRKPKFAAKLNKIVGNDVKRMSETLITLMQWPRCHWRHLHPFLECLAQVAALLQILASC